ncbi:uncharacterized protein SCHCODRAFT_02501252 [Schizophyllum commune H4-8]|nr:uncharacterized protein SCHCODRAFT_02501252 [Schizophyllum commune H4-8]KAI5893616.1 hypothetical protein SCHCODRAFT_02501252 [Schizophyllum commune H4-8]
MLHHAKQAAKRLAGHVVPGLAESHSGGGRQKAARKTGKKYKRAEKKERRRTEYYDGKRMPASSPNVARTSHPAVHPHVQVVTPGPYYSYPQPQVPAPPPHYYGQPERHPRSHYAPRREPREHDPGRRADYAPPPPSHRPRRPSVHHPDSYFARPSSAPRPPPSTHSTNRVRAAPLQYPVHYGYFY